MNVVIVESPAKAKTINKYLGKDYKVLASFGHIRDLSPKNGSVLPEEDFAMKWEISPATTKRLSEIVKEVKNADNLILATDPDREGEAISWHVLEVLKQKKALKNQSVQRVVFNAITKNSILEAMKNPRNLDFSLIDAYLARRALDYLFGFTLSPILWRKLPGARSAGRVQSVALRLLCDRESEIEKFVEQDYWSIHAFFQTESKENFATRLIKYNEEKLDKLTINTEEKALSLKSMIERSSFHIASIESKPTKRRPSPPFTTSTLQQAASAKLGFSPAYTMQLSQNLYEGITLNGETTGLITYMRTDGVQMASEAIDEARESIKDLFGPKYCPEKALHYTAKAKNAQEAHEAIRPTSFKRTPEYVKAYLTEDQRKLYDLIWKRALASQMSFAEIERTTIDIHAKNSENIGVLRANGSVIRFEGFLKAYKDHRDQDDSNEENLQLPLLKKEDPIDLNKVESQKHTTEPPARYSEASLIKKLEELGIGRPSTYASTMTTLKDRGYTILEKKRLIPVAKGRIVVSFLENFFHHYVEYNFTAHLEDELDLISDGKLEWKKVLEDFWKNFNQNIDSIKELRISDVIDHLNESLKDFLFQGIEKEERKCPQCEDGHLSLKLGRYGAFIGCSNYPECNFAKQLNSQNGEVEIITSEEPIILGYGLFDEDLDENVPVTLRTGRFGPYVQYGDDKDKKRMAIPKVWSPEEVDLQKARSLLQLPRIVGLHPETQSPITATIGRYGPYLSHEKKTARLEMIDDVFQIELQEAVDLLSKESQKTPRKTNSASPLREIGEYEDEKITVHNGRFGPYLKWKKMNVTIPKTFDIDNITLEDSQTLIMKKQEKEAKKKTK